MIPGRWHSKFILFGEATLPMKCGSINDWKKGCRKKMEKRHERKKIQKHKRRDDGFFHKSIHDARPRIMRPAYIMPI